MADRRGEELLSAVLAAPAEDAPRLVYADWLLEVGDPHGELVAVACTRARHEREGTRRAPGYRAARARERELLAAHGRAWADPLRPARPAPELLFPSPRARMTGAGEASFSRGFVTRIAVGPGALRTTLARLAETPLEAIDLVGASTLGDLATLASHPVSERLETVRLEGQGGIAELDWQTLIGALDVPSEVAAIPAWPAGTGVPIASLRPALRRLVLASPSGAELADLAVRPPPALRALAISTARLGPADLTLLLANPDLRTLEDLTLASLDEASAVAALEAPPRTRSRLPGLVRLTVTGRERLGPAVTRALGRSRLLGALASLRVDLALDEALVGAIVADAPGLLELSALGPAADRGVVALARSPVVSRLRRLTLVGSDTALGPPSPMPLLRADLSRLEALSLDRFLVGDANTATLAGADALAGLVELRLARSGLTAERARTIARSRHLDALVAVDLSGNGLGSTELDELRRRWPLADVSG